LRAPGLAPPGSSSSSVLHAAAAVLFAVRKGLVDTLSEAGQRYMLEALVTEATSLSQVHARAKLGWKKITASRHSSSATSPARGAATGASHQLSVQADSSFLLSQAAAAADTAAAGDAVLGGVIRLTTLLVGALGEIPAPLRMRTEVGGPPNQPPSRLPQPQYTLWTTPDTAREAFQAGLLRGLP
jgi:hypothetical protein